MACKDDTVLVVDYVEPPEGGPPEVCHMHLSFASLIQESDGLVHLLAVAIALRIGFRAGRSTRAGASHVIRQLVQDSGGGKTIGTEKRS
jgi:hypothetical protein